MARSVQQFRIFLSSPGDVAEERGIVRDYIKEALPYSPFIRGRATFDVVSWDDPEAMPGLEAPLTPQEAINKKLPKPSDCDIVLVVLWSRMGTPLPSAITREDGSTYHSGTEWEYEDAVQAAKATGSPVTLLYRRMEEPKIGLNADDLQDRLAQYAAVKAFFDRFRDTDGALSGSVTFYDRAGGFLDILRQTLDSVVADLLGDGFSDELGVTKSALKNFFQILEEHHVPPEQLNAKLQEIAERHKALTENLHRLSKSHDDPAIAEQREQAAEAIEAGDYDRAAALLEEAATIDWQAIGEQQDALERRKLSVAETLVQNAELERTRLNYRKAAGHYLGAASLVPHAEEEIRLGYQVKQALLLYDQGREFGENEALVQAIALFRQILDQRSRERGPLDWAMTQNNLGSALQTLGARESGRESLDLAIQAYREALKELTRNHGPLDWAMIQNNLGSTLVRLGERERGRESLDLAVQAYREALKELTREREPLDWATTQNNLGSALVRLGERERGRRSLDLAIQAYREALKELTREREPLDWAMTQNNLGIALQTLGERESGRESLDLAIEAYREALKEWTQKRVPLSWAMTQNNLGTAFQTLGARENDRESLDVAVQAYREALKEFRRERVPLSWAMTQNNLGNALRTLGAQENGRESLDLAIQAYREALKEWTRECSPLNWAMTQANLGVAYRAIAEKSRERTVLLEGIEALQAALVVVEEGEADYYIENFQGDLAKAEALLAEIRKEVASIEAGAARIGPPSLDSTLFEPPESYSSLSLRLKE